WTPRRHRLRRRGADVLYAFELLLSYGCGSSGRLLCRRDAEARRHTRPPWSLEREMGTNRQAARSLCRGRPYASGCSDSRATVSERRQEPIAAAGHRGDEARLPPIVLESGSQVANLAVYHVALGHVVHAPQRVQDLLAGDHAASVGRKQVQQALLQ